VPLSNANAKLLFDAMIGRLAEAFRSKVPEELLLVMHFGSTVAPVLKSTTDIDLFLVYRDPPPGKFARQALFDVYESKVTGELEQLRSGGFDLVFSPFIKGGDVLERFLPIYLDFPEHSRVLYDPNGLAQKLIPRIKSMRLRQGIKLEHVKGMRVWNCRGNLAPGELFVPDF
jgi:hypothetical protein